MALPYASSFEGPGIGRVPFDVGCVTLLGGIHFAFCLRPLFGGALRHFARRDSPHAGMLAAVDRMIGKQQCSPGPACLLPHPIELQRGLGGLRLQP